MTESRCERCGASFGCEAGSGNECWCSELVLTDAQRAALAEEFRSCLCPACLAALAAGRVRPAHVP
jgi:hypothetical protein